MLLFQSLKEYLICLVKSILSSYKIDISTFLPSMRTEFERESERKRIRRAQEKNPRVYQRKGKEFDGPKKRTQGFIKERSQVGSRPNGLLSKQKCHVCSVRTELISSQRTPTKKNISFIFFVSKQLIKLEPAKRKKENEVFQYHLHPSSTSKSKHLLCC